MLIYEYLENNCLGRALFGKHFGIIFMRKHSLQHDIQFSCSSPWCFTFLVRTELLLYLDWPTRKKICLGIARGLAYLHEESRLKIVHRDIKATNVLLDKDLNAKISDFGLAKLDEEENTHISTRIAGTM